MNGEDYFDDKGPATAVADEGGEHEQDGGDKEGNEQTALINSEICPGMKPGDKIELRIEAVHEGEYSVSYAPKEEGGEEEHEPKADMQAPPSDSLMD